MILGSRTAAAAIGLGVLLGACAALPNLPAVSSSSSVSQLHATPIPSLLHAEPESDPDPDPPLTRDEVRLVVRAKLPEVRGCFEAGLVDDPALAGRVALRFTIDAGGRVRDPTIVEDQLASSTVGACLLEQLLAWQFPLPRAGRELTIVYPFHFTPEDTLRAAGLPRVQGTLRPAAVGELFDAHRRELDECLAAGGLTRGTIGVAFTIDDAGFVAKIASYRGDLPTAVSGCILRVIASWSFPPAAPGDEVSVNHDLEW